MIPFNQTCLAWRRSVASMLLAVLAPAHAGAVTDIAAWPLDEQRGSRTLEAVSGRHDPVDYVFNHARFKPDSDPLWRPATACIKGGCLLFDGYSTDITAPGLTAAQLGAGWTVSAWVAPHAFEWGDGGQYSAFLSQFDEASKTGFVFGMYRFGTWGIKLGFGGAEFDLRVSDRKLAKDAWSHVAASYDPRGRVVRLFLDGEQVAAGAAPAEGSFALPAPDRDHCINGFDAGLERFFYRLTIDNTRRFTLQRHLIQFAGDRAFSVNRLAQHIYNTTHQTITYF